MLSRRLVCPIPLFVTILATGCPDVDPPANARVERTGDQVSIKCQYSTSAWHLTCSGHEWIGKIGVCPGMLGNSELNGGFKVSIVGVIHRCYINIINCEGTRGQFITVFIVIYHASIMLGLKVFYMTKYA